MRKTGWPPDVLGRLTLFCGDALVEQFVDEDEARGKRDAAMLGALGFR